VPSSPKPPPGTIVTTDLVRDVFGLQSTILADPYSGTPLVVPAERGALTS